MTTTDKKPQTNPPPRLGGLGGLRMQSGSSTT